MLKPRWYEPDDPTTPVDWRAPALIIATLFSNFVFWYTHGDDFWMFARPPLDIGVLFPAALLIAALFFAGPALATQAAKRPLTSVLVDSVGSIPALALRLSGFLFLLIWISKMLSTAWWWVESGWRPVSAIEFGVIAATILLFAAFTGSQSLRISAALARFTIRLAIAILLAALIRVHLGWPAVLKGFPVVSQYSPAVDLGRGLSYLCFYAAPLAFLAADFGSRVRGRKLVAMTALMGIAVPLAGSLLLVGAINVATAASPYYQPSLNPNIGMALWGQAARRAVGPRMLIVAVTLFGSLRFGMRALEEKLPGRFSLLAQGCSISAIVWFSLHPTTKGIETVFEFCTMALVAASAVLTADVIARRQLVRARRIDWVGTLALVSGLAVPACIRVAESWWHPWLLPSYGIAFTVCLFGRMVFHPRLSAFISSQ